MRISVIGTGYVGLVSGICFAYLGHDVLGLDRDEAKIRALEAGVLPIYEPELDRLFYFARSKGKIRFTQDYEEAVRFAEFIFIAVGTPPKPDGSADLSFVESALREIAQHLREGEFKIIVNKSTVPVGTGKWAKAYVSSLLESRGISSPESLFDVVSNPEFLREGKAVFDFMNPDRVVIGSDDRTSAWRVASLYEKVDPTLLVCDLVTAEMIKYTANAFLATKISFINEIANICERVGADVEVVSRALGLDHRISPHFLKAGLGFGGSCFPKDLSALISIARAVGVDARILPAVWDVNVRQRKKPIVALESALGDLRGRVIGVLGLAFKPGTDDVRESPALDIVRDLNSKGAVVLGHDPIAGKNFVKEVQRFGGRIELVDRVEDLLQRAEGVVLVTDWPEYQDVDLELLRGKVLFDGRNVFKPEIAKEFVSHYFRVG